MKRVFSASGYNQWIVNGVADNSFETCFSQVESHLPKTLKALVTASALESTVLPAHIYENLCRYCAMLRFASPQAKASAIANILLQLNYELEWNQRVLWHYLGIPDDVIDRFQYEHSQGRWIIVECDNPVHWAFRIHYNRSCDHAFLEFLMADWRILHSPFDLPISDIGIVPICWSKLRANHYLLPIAPRLLLECVYHFDQTLNSREPKIKSRTLPKTDADFYFESICLSAVSQIVCVSEDSKVPACLSAERSSEDTQSFHQFPNPGQITNSGMKRSDGMFTLRAVTVEEYVGFMHSFVRPPASAKAS